MSKAPERLWQAKCEARRAVGLLGKVRWSVSLRADVYLLDLSLRGCRIQFAAEPMSVGTAVFIRPADLCTLRSTVRWSTAYAMGLEFDHPLHPAVLEHLVTVSDWTYWQQRGESIVPMKRFTVASGFDRG